MKLGSLDISKIKIGTANVTKVYVGSSLVYEDTPTPTGYSAQYLTFVPVSGSSTFTFNGNNISYSLDSGATWTELASNTASPSVSQGQKIMWKASGLTVMNGIGTFSSTNYFDVEGNVMSLVSGDTFENATTMPDSNRQFYRLFRGNTNLVNAENLILPATSLIGQCYDSMFSGCTSLTTAPELPATTLAGSCYQHMFRGCTSLTTAPELPATTLAGSCYNYMFRDCTSLSAVTCLATDISANNSTNNWLYNVSSSGTFTKAASMTGWTTGVNGIPTNWTIVNSGETPSASCITSSEGQWIQVDENFDVSNPIPIYEVDMSGLNMGAGMGTGFYSSGFDIYDENGNWLGQLESTWDYDNDYGWTTINDSNGQEIFNEETLEVDVCQLFGGPIYIQDVPTFEWCDTYECTEYECLEWDCLEYDEETGECIEEGDCIQEGDCIRYDCGQTSDHYPLSIFVPNDALQGGVAEDPAV